jgi:hypothetical protein
MKNEGLRINIHWLQSEKTGKRKKGVETEETKTKIGKV